MAFLQVAIFIPVKSTLLKAAKNGHLTSWPGMTPENVRIYFKAKFASAKGHRGASGRGAGGVWFPLDHLVPREGFKNKALVWRLEFE